MHIDHLAIWVDDLEKMRDFYLTYFDTSCNKRYVNPVKQFYSYFITFNQGGSRIELMHRPDIKDNPAQRGSVKGLTHFAITVGNQQKVNSLVEQLRSDNYTVIGEPRTSGDGYYEAVILDPEGNVVELLAEQA